MSTTGGSGGMRPAYIILPADPRSVLLSPDFGARTVSLQRALLFLVTAALLASIVPAWLLLDSQLAAELEARAREKLKLGPLIVADRNAAILDAMSMHAKELAGAPELGRALAEGNREAALGIVQQRQQRSSSERPLLVNGSGEVLIGGAAPASTLLNVTRIGETLARVVPDGDGLRMLALAPVTHAGEWVGAAGVDWPLDAAVASTLAGLTRSQVVILRRRAEVVAGTLPDSIAGGVARAAAEWPANGRVYPVEVANTRYLAARTRLGSDATIVFLRNVREELGILPKLRQVALMSATLALLVALLLGTLFARWIARPVRSLTVAADRLAKGSFDAPLEPSRIREVNHLSRDFQEMRTALATRMEDLHTSNRELADREARLTALQAEFIQRERLTASGRMVAELAHEIRNPVASVRNCVEVILRRLDSDPTGREFANLAIDELLRMHELAERMLDLNRPADPGRVACRAGTVAKQVRALLYAGSPVGYTIRISGDDISAAIPPDALKQVFLNLVGNAREAVGEGLELDIDVRSVNGQVRIAVQDNGPGIAPEVLPRIFDPFFTTKTNTGGVGLGLSVADGIVRKYGGRLYAENADNPMGARFIVELPRAADEPA